jgi:hypothetical protein
MFGKAVLSQHQVGIACKLNVSNLSAGAYIVKLQRSNGQVFQQKLLKN